MIALLDVNVLVALFDPAHIHHETAHTWFGARRDEGWATCPLTENGCVRVLSNPAYPGNRTTLEDAVRRLERFRRSGGHAFWPDSVSLCDAGRFDLLQVAGSRQLADAYLLALAVANRGSLATLDRGIPLVSVAGAGAQNLIVIEG
ncbi:MAG: TA system VapC family ribonuclease toxin [Thermoanaerobaculia bacterium]